MDGKITYPVTEYLKYLKYLEYTEIPKVAVVHHVSWKQYN